MLGNVGKGTTLSILNPKMVSDIVRIKNMIAKLRKKCVNTSPMHPNNEMAEPRRRHVSS